MIPPLLLLGFAALEPAVPHADVAQFAAGQGPSALSPLLRHESAAAPPRSRAHALNRGLRKISAPMKTKRRVRRFNRTAAKSSLTEALGSTTLQRCHYIPSPVEQSWMTRNISGHICEHATHSSQIRAAHEWLEYVREARGATSHLTRSPIHLSRWHCDDGRVEYIEPLTGIARHPFAKVGCRYPKWMERQNRTTHVLNVSYLMLANDCGRMSEKGGGGGGGGGAAPRRAVLYDLGCSVYAPGRGDPRFDGRGLGPSLPLFDGMYRSQCLPLERIYGWEAQEMDTKEWWKPVPASVRSRLTFYNIPISEEEEVDVEKKEEAAAAGSRARALGSARGAEPTTTWAERDGTFSAHLLSAVSPEDFVAVKLDIDHRKTEAAIADAIRRRPEVASRVDEFFFEYHFAFDDLDFGWHSGKGMPGAVDETVDDALWLMQRLRRKGIRAHFWV